ncbi:MAG: DMT family transporter [Lachnospiraceae bacterium]
MKQFQGKLYLLGAFSLAGTSVITGSILTEKLDSFTITAISLGIVLLCFLPFYGVKVLQTIRILTKNDWFMIICQAVFGIFLFRTFLLFGVGLTSTMEAGILTGTTPAITSVLAFLLLKEKLSRTTVLGVCCTVIGIILLQGINVFSAMFSVQHILGNMLIICGAASESAFNIISRKHNTRTGEHSEVQLHPMVQTLLVSAIALALSIIPALYNLSWISIPALGWREWLALIWYGAVVTALAFVFFYEGVKRCDAYTTAAFSGMIPLTSMLLSLVLLKENIECTQLIGGLLIILSMTLIGHKKPSLNKQYHRIL